MTVDPFATASAAVRARQVVRSLDTRNDRDPPPGREEAAPAGQDRDDQAMPFPVLSPSSSVRWPRVFPGL